MARIRMRPTVSKKHFYRTVSFLQHFGTSHQITGSWKRSQNLPSWSLHADCNYTTKTQPAPVLPGFLFFYLVFQAPVKTWRARAPAGRPAEAHPGHRYPGGTRSYRHLQPRRSSKADGSESVPAAARCDLTPCSRRSGVLRGSIFGPGGAGTRQARAAFGCGCSRG